MYISLKKYAKEHNIKRRQAFRVLNDATKYRKVDPLEVGSNKVSVNVYKKIA